jgi:hypothetical protein
MLEQPHTPYKPLFNRTYLKYLGFVVAIAIVFLSKKAPSPIDQPSPIENALSSLQVLVVEDIDKQRLLLSFPTFPALTPQSKIERRVAYQNLQSKIESIPKLHALLWTYDRLEVELRWVNDSNDANISIAAILNNLFNDSYKSDSEQQRKLIAAEYYLESKKADNALLATLDKSLASQYQSPTLIPQILSISPSALLISDKDISGNFFKDVDKQISSLFSKQSAQIPQSYDWRATSSSIKLRNNRHNLLIASELKQTSNQQNKLELLANFVLSEILKKELQGKGIQFRLIKQQIFSRGYQSVMLSSSDIMTDSLVSLIENKINNSTFDKELASVKKRLIEQYRLLADNPERLYKLYSKKQFYRLSTESASQYESLIDDITSEQIRAHMRRFVSEPTHTIFLQPS